MIVVDANFLMLLFEPDALPHVDRGGDRVRRLIDDLTKSRETIMIPAPAIAEVVAGRVDRVDEIVAEIRTYRVLEVQPFDQVIAIETGILIRRWLDGIPQQDRREGDRISMKYDAQIAATALTRRARAICTDDRNYGVWLEGTGIEILKLAELNLPPDPPQHPLPWAEDE